ncbi:MAG: glycosyltransferase family 1 protein [Pseudanabaena sp.]|nr:MAG: glycosyltransferase family 1 protein [Pseudanabaena sp.]
MHILIAALHRPTDPTGVCRVAANLARCLVDRREISQITIAIGKWQEHYFGDLLETQSNKIKLISIDIKNTSLSRNRWFLFGLPKLARQHQADRVHLSFPLPFLRSQFPCPVVATIHDLYPYQFPENFGYKQAIFNQLFLRWCIHQSDGITCVSRTTLEALNLYFPKIKKQSKPTTVIYNFVDFSKVRTNPSLDFQKRFEFPFILCVAQHRKNKNIDLLIKTYDLLKSSNQIDLETRLVLVGSPGPETNSLLKLIHEKSLESSILMLSSIDDHQLCWLYQHCQLFVMPSSLEGFCIPIVEALFFSCKVICSNIAIFQEIGNTDCTYFDLTGDPIHNLSQVIQNVLKEISSSNTNHYLRFSKTSIADQYITFYSKLS